MGNLRDKYTDEEWDYLLENINKKNYKELESLKKESQKNQLDIDYQNLVRDIINNGTQKKDRTGTGIRSLFGRQIRHKMSNGFPLLTTKKLSFNNIRTELEWFLNGDTNIRYLLENKNYIWVGDAFKRYLSIEDDNERKLSRKEFIDEIIRNDEFSQKWGDMGHIYGKQWREWSNYESKKSIIELPNGEEIHSPGLFKKRFDQINILFETLRDDPDSRRMMVNAWNVGELDKMILPPCHYGFQVYTREMSWDERRRIYQPEVDGILTEEWADEMGLPKRAISLMWNQRSVDVGLGLPYNIASYGLLLIMIANEVNMVPDELIGNLGDTHLYLNHIEPIKEQLCREPFPLPELLVHNGLMSRGKGDFQLKNYISHPKIDLPLSN